MQDTNDEEHLSQIEQTFERIFLLLEEEMNQTRHPPEIGRTEGSESHTAHAEEKT